MKTNLEYILKALKKYNSIIKISYQDTISIDAVHYLDSRQTIFEPDILYLGTVSGFSEIRNVDCPINLLLIQDSDQLSDCQSQEMLNMIILESYPPLEVLYEEIVSLLKNSKQIMQKSLRLYDRLATGQGLKDLVNFGGAVLGNPIIVVDNGMKILAYSQNDQPDATWNELIEKGFHPYELTKAIIADGVTEKFMNEEMPVIFMPESRETQHLGWRLVIAGKIVGYIAVIDNYRPFEEDDIEILTVLCKVVSIELQKNNNYWQTKGMVFKDLINDLLNDQLKNTKLVNERLKYLDIKFNEFLTLLVAEYKLESTQNIPFSYIQETLEATVFGGRCAVYNNKLVLVINRRTKNSFSEEEVLKINKLLEEYQMIAGVSRSFCDITRLKNYYDQSIKATELGLHFDVKKSIYIYEDYMEYHLIETAASLGEVKAICSPMISDLIEYDRQNKSELVNSLFAYLSSGNNLAESALKIGIHRNSMNYRIRKIEEVLNIKVDDPHTSLILNLSLKILRFYDRSSV